ncbi:MAG TPA: sigma-54 dependent transcriptional regulator [Syntrophomonadaceae bacterium]|nr:sigma-54 dependent transcriptional regulator [Syntrophomonadaceae bacterium]
MVYNVPRKANSYQILVVDDMPDNLKLLTEILTNQGYKVRPASNGQLALRSVAVELPDLILLDVRMPGMDGYEVCQYLKAEEKTRRIPVIFISALDEVADKVRGFHIGGVDYITKPFQSEEVLARVETHLTIRRLQTQLEEQNLQLQTEIAERKQAAEELRLNQQRLEAMRQENTDANRKLGDLKKLVAQSIGLGRIYYASDSMRKIINEAQKYHSDRSIPVLIQGETGTGKELIARLIHFGDMEVIDKPFIDINCAAINPQLFESEFFGYESGAFTGGLNKGQIGKFDLASGGTIFLDEIAEIPLELQSKLLRVIEVREFYRVGGINKIESDVRIVCATNVDIEEKVREGKFRKDLYYRLGVGFIKIPPLRDRKESIIPLAKMFMDKFSNQKGKVFGSISEQAAEILIGYNWPGNVRELQNLIEWVVFMYDDVVLQPLHLDTIRSDTVQLLKKKKGVRGNPSQTEILSHVNKALELYAGNKTKAAKHLGISRPSLYKLLKMQK